MKPSDGTTPPTLALASLPMLGGCSTDRGIGDDTGKRGEGQGRLQGAGVVSRLGVIAFALSLALLSGCQETNTETARDVAGARREAAEADAGARQEASKEMDEANRDVSDAKADYEDAEGEAGDALEEAETEARVAAAQARYDVAHTEALGRHEVARQRCDGQSVGQARDDCMVAADDELAVEESRAALERDKALQAATGRR